MVKLDLSKYGIQDVKEILHNPSYEVLFEEETKAGLDGYEKGQVTDLKAYSTGETISVTGLLDTEALTIEPGSKLTLGEKDYIIESVDQNETNTGYTEVTLSACTADSADIDPYAAETMQQKSLTAEKGIDRKARQGAAPLGPGKNSPAFSVFSGWKCGRNVNENRNRTVEINKNGGVFSCLQQTSSEPWLHLRNFRDFLRKTRICGNWRSQNMTEGTSISD